MRFKDYILEQEGPPQHENFEDLLHQIKTRCKPYLEQASRPIFRGVSARYMRAGYTPHPTERPPRDSGRAFNFAFNAGYQLAHKVPSVRTRTVFATGNAAATAEYGEVAFFFPAGDFKYGWSSDIDDSYDDEGKIMDQIHRNFKSISGVQKPDAQNIGQMFEDLTFEISPAQWVTNRNDEGEDMTLQVVSTQPPTSMWAQVKNIHSVLTESLRSSFDTLYFDNEDLGAAVKSGNEILFYKTDGYYMIPYSDVQLHMQLRGLHGSHYNRQERYEWLLEQIKDAE